MSNDSSQSLDSPTNEAVMARLLELENRTGYSKQDILCILGYDLLDLLYLYNTYIAYLPYVRGTYDSQIQPYCNNNASHRLLLI